MPRHAAAQAGRFLHQDHCHAGVRQFHRRGQAGDSAADHQHWIGRIRVHWRLSCAAAPRRSFMRSSRRRSKNAATASPKSSSSWSSRAQRLDARFVHLEQVQKTGLEHEAAETVQIVAGHVEHVRLLRRQRLVAVPEIVKRQLLEAAAHHFELFDALAFHPLAHRKRNPFAVALAEVFLNHEVKRLVVAAWAISARPRPAGTCGRPTGGRGRFRSPARKGTGSACSPLPS